MDFLTRTLMAKLIKHYRGRGRLKNEELLTLLNETGGEFVCHAVADCHKALNVCKGD